MENPKHTVKNNNDGRFTLAMNGAAPKVHTFIPSPTPSVSPSVTPSVTPTRTPVPSVTPTISVTPSPSYQNSNLYAVYGITNDGTGLTGTGDTAGFDGGGYTYSWQNLFANATTFYDAGTYWINDNGPGGSNEFFPIGPAAGQLGTVVNQPRWFKAWYNDGYHLTIACPYSNKRRVWLLAAGIEGGGNIGTYYNIRNKSTNTYSILSTGNIYMDDWCAGSTSQSVAVSMSRRNDAGGGEQSLTARIYRYSLPATTSDEEIVNVNFYNAGLGNPQNTRIVSVAFADA